MEDNRQNAISLLPISNCSEFSGDCANQRPNGQYVLVANEGQPDQYFLIDDESDPDST